MKKPLIILTGPTAVGKTKISIALAKRLNGEIISADSMQVYKDMNIGSAKISPSEMDGIPHYLIDVLQPDELFNVVLFQQMAKKAMDEIYKKGKTPIIVGGTGFYIQSIVFDIDFTEHSQDTDYRKYLEGLSQEKGGKYLHELLQSVDRKAALDIHENNTKRVIRALEYFHQTGMKISTHNEKEQQKNSPYDYCYIVLNDKRELLYERINQRIDKMLEQGLVNEVKELQRKGYHKEMVSMQGLGYKEILTYLEGTCSLEDAVYLLKRDTRHFAKRQLTWFKREKDVVWVNKDEYDEDKILAIILGHVKERISYL